MISRATRALADRKGFSLREAVDRDRYWVVDRYTGLPELNPEDEAIAFSLESAVVYLRRLPDQFVAA